MKIRPPRYTQTEALILELLGTAWNQFVSLKYGHPMDKAEFCQAIHAAQNIVMARFASRHEASGKTKNNRRTKRPEPKGPGPSRRDRYPSRA